MTTTAQQAQETQIWVIENGKPVQTNLYDFVMATAEETTSPRGVENKLHIRQNEENQTFEVWDWGFRGNHPSMVESFSNEEKAEDFIFERIFKYDFPEELDFDTRYFYSEAEAIEAIIQDIKNTADLSLETARSIYNHKLLADKIIAEREVKRRIESEKQLAANLQAAKEIAAKIEMIPGERYNETAKRLSAQLTSKIEGSVFHKAVKLIRDKK